jgi:hypothetical protein
VRYRKLDSTGDMVFGHGGNDFLVDSPDAVAQAVETRLREWKGEWFLDTSEGTPWQALMGKGTQKSIDPEIRARILATEGVTEITAFAVVINPTTRKATITATINTDYGETTAEVTA